MEVYVHGSKERLLQAARGDRVDGLETVLVVVDKRRRNCKFIDFAVLEDSRIEEKEKEKMKKYQDLRKEL